MAMFNDVDQLFHDRSDEVVRPEEPALLGDEGEEIGFAMVEDDVEDLGRFDDASNRDNVRVVRGKHVKSKFAPLEFTRPRVEVPVVDAFHGC